MLALLVADDPRRSADRILTRLIQIHQARGGAVLRPRQDQAEIWLSAGLNLSAVAELPVRWAVHYLAQPEDLAVGDARVFGAAIAQAVQAAEAAPGPRWAPETSPTEEARLQLLSLLERHEWNIAEVARLLGVTRRTVYMRLRSFGIERRHVPKIYKKMPVEG